MKANIRFSYINLYVIILLTFACSCNKDPGPKNNLGTHSPSLQDSIHVINLFVEKIRNDSNRLQTALENSLPSNNKINQLVLYQSLGDLHLKNLHFTSAIQNHREYLKLSEEFADSFQILKALNLLAIDYLTAYQMDNAIRYFFRARKMAADLQNADNSILREKAVSLNGIGKIYSMLEYPDEALNSFRESYRYAKKANDAEIQADNLMGIGNAYKEKELYDSARIYFNKSADLFIEINSRTGLGLTFFCFGNLSIKQDNYQEALIFLTNAYNTLKETSDKLNWMEVCFTAGNTYKKLSQYAEAEKYLVEGLEIAKELNLPFYLKNAYSDLSDIYYLQNKPALAQQYHIISHSFDNLINRNETQAILFNAYADYEKMESNKQLTGMKTVFDARSNQQRIIIVAFIIIITLLIITFLTYNRYSMLKKQKDKSLVEVARLKSDFYTNITHEFKTPISIIIGLAEKLKKNTSESKSPHNLIDLDIIGRQSENLLFLVNEILTVSKIQTSKRINWINGNIVSHLRYLHSCYMDFAETKKITYLFHSGADEIIMDYSREQIRVIVNNLLTNSIKHCTEGKKILLMVREDKKQKKCIIEVADNGEGIAAKDLPHIFKTFYQGESDQREQMGVGIGLAFTKQVVESLEGTIHVRSVPFKETVFTVEIPITNHRHATGNQPSEEVVPAARRFEVSHSELEDEKEDSNKPLILIAEDNRDMIFYLTTVLRDEYNVVVAHDGRQAMDFADEKTPDLIISDLMMPLVDGNKLCSHIKNSVMTSHIPIIVLTAKTSDEDRIQLIKAGADAYMTKPFIEEELKVKINQLLKSRKELREKYSQVVLESQNASPDLTNDSNFEFLQKVTDIIYREMKSMDFFPQGLASEMCVSPSQLNRKIKSISGLNATNYILMVRLNRAKKLLTTSQKPIGEIAMDCGFNDFAYFSRTFKKEFGITPSKFQRMPHAAN
ncbi:MAG: response regulator [Petrimonas sp.]|nr:response regulator [Petrimonas sp.]